MNIQEAVKKEVEENGKCNHGITCLDSSDNMLADNEKDTARVI